jgi:hypothetical protein
MAAHISAALRRQIRAEVGEHCGYCKSSERWLGIPHDVEHIIPEAAGGESGRDNLWLACRRCNSFKSNRCEAIDSLTGNSVALFHPRNDQWKEHFEWSFDGTTLLGLTACGRATIEALQINHPLIVAAREMWARLGVHPPSSQ